MVFLMQSHPSKSPRPVSSLAFWDFNPSRMLQSFFWATFGKPLLAIWWWYCLGYLGPFSSQTAFPRLHKLLFILKCVFFFHSPINGHISSLWNLPSSNRHYILSKQWSASDLWFSQIKSHSGKKKPSPHCRIHSVLSHSYPPYHSRRRVYKEISS